jgi:hypothetical protein
MARPVGGYLGAGELERAGASTMGELLDGADPSSR